MTHVTIASKPKICVAHKRMRHNLIAYLPPKVCSYLNKSASQQNSKFHMSERAQKSLNTTEMKRDNHGLRTYFPSLEYIRYPNDSPEEYSGKRVTSFRKQTMSKNLKKETSKLKDILHVFNSFRFNIPHIQCEIFKAMPQLVTGTADAGPDSHVQSEHKVQVQDLAAKSKIIQDLLTVFERFNAELLKSQEMMNKFITAQVTPKSPTDVYPYCRLDSPASASIFYKRVGFLSPAMANCSCIREEITKDNVEHHLKDRDKSFPALISISTTPARIYNISKKSSFHDKRKCYVYIIDPDVLQTLSVTCHSTPDLVKQLGLKRYSLSNQGGAQYITPSHHIYHALIPAEAIIMKLQLDVYYLFLEKTGITKGMSSDHLFRWYYMLTSSKARTLLDTSCIKKPTVQDYLDFTGNHNKTCVTDSIVEMGPIANSFLSP